MKSSDKSHSPAPNGTPALLPAEHRKPSIRMDGTASTEYRSARSPNARRLSPSMSYLGSDTSVNELIRATVMNHISWFSRRAEHSGGEVFREPGVIWSVAPDETTIAFPRLKSAEAGATLDRIIAALRERKPKSIGCWALTPTVPRDLGARLAARGFEWGWKPHWMSMDFRKLPADYRLPDGLRIVADDANWDVEGLPYYDRAKEANMRSIAAQRPQQTWHFGAWLDGKIVGHTLLFVTTGRYGIAGIYNVGVLPEARLKGIGKALMIEVCRFAQALGCRHALLNSAASEFYSRIGFESLGWGQSWWMQEETIAAPPPTRAQIIFAEAIGRGDIKTLNAVGKDDLPQNLNAPLPCGMTPIELAVRPNKPASAEWLAERGATLDARHAWDLGWKQRVPQLLKDNPGLVNNRMGHLMITPLHEAVMRGDVEFARVLLAANPDLDIKDKEYHSNPLGWARHFNRAEIITLIEQQGMF